MGIVYNCGGTIIDFSKPKVMGILNVTPDSFYDGGKYSAKDAIQARIESMIEGGADIIDVGAASSKPGSTLIHHSDELARLKPVFELMTPYQDSVLFSIDTFNSVTAETALNNGFHIINDISGAEIDDDILGVVSKHNAVYVAMHMQGIPSTMQDDPKYDNVTMDILKHFSNRVREYAQRGVHQVIIDPGFGFGKLVTHNYELLNNLGVFNILNKPILAGLSRKSMFYKPLKLTPNDVLPASLAAGFKALEAGAKILRVHDVVSTVQIVKVFNLLNENHR